MPRQLRLAYPGAIYHVLSRANGKGNIVATDVDRQDFLKTLAEAGAKTGFQVHAYCLMRNHFHLVVETPQGNLVAGRRWFLSADTPRFNPRHQRFGPVFSGRYKALMVDGSGTGYLGTVCDYVPLHPVRAKLLQPDQRLLEYPWSSCGSFLAAPAHRPTWLRVDRGLGEHGIARDDVAGRGQLEQWMEGRRAQESDGEQWQAIRRGWFLGAPEFKASLLEKMERGLGDHHSGESSPGWWIGSIGLGRGERMGRGGCGMWRMGGCIVCGIYSGRWWALVEGQIFLLLGFVYGPRN